ncbi:MAG: hypothetical protein IJW98_04765 [Clostridia bacterium]|nr:hypothetical protein [Clostridia bacterium]
MAQRPVFIPHSRKPFYRVVNIPFTFNPGFALSQKQKNVAALHEGYQRLSGDIPLEISSKSLKPEGVAASAFNLTKYVPSLDRRISVECAYQGSKVFQRGGPYTDLYQKSSKEAKRDPRFAESGRIVSFCFDGISCESYPESCFYDWLYISALTENPELAEKLPAYNAFTDIEFNPDKSLNCQARSAAIFVALTRNGLMDAVKDYQTFRKLFMEG